MFGTRKYDDIDWHEGAASTAGQPREYAFTHVGLYIEWVMRHDLHEPDMWPQDHVLAVLSGEMTGSDLADDCDGKLLSDMLSQEGAAFRDARYVAYLDAYSAVFGSEPDYSIPDDEHSYGLVAPLIDDLYAAWVSDGRPPALPEEHPDSEAP